MKQIKVHISKKFQKIDGSNVFLWNLAQSQNFNMTSLLNSDCILFSGVCNPIDLLKFIFGIIGRKVVVLRVDGILVVSSWRSYLNYICTLFIYRFCTSVIYQSSVSKMLWQKKHPKLKPRRQQVIGNFSLIDTDMLIDTNSVDNETKILIISRNSAIKRVNETLNSIQRNIDVFGPVSVIVNYVGPYVKNRWDGFELRIHEQLSRAEIRESILSADLILHLATYDAYPNVVVEAHTLRRPVIISSTCGCTDIVDPRLTLYEKVADSSEAEHPVPDHAFRRCVKNWREGRYEINAPAKDLIISKYAVALSGGE